MLPALIALAAACTHVPPEVATQFEQERDPARNHYLAGTAESPEGALSPRE